MHIKRFEAATIEEALAQVKVELGPDALILSSRTIRKGRYAFGLMAKTRVEIQAASERLSPTEEFRRMRVDSDSVAVDEMGERDERHRSKPAVTSELDRALALLRGRERFEEEVRSELRGLRSALQGVLGTSLRESADPVAESLSRGGLDWMHAESLVAQWRDTHVDRTPGRGDLEELLIDRIEKKLAAPRVDEDKRLRILVGAPGVGKTTTLAKLAARNDEGEREVALVSLDHYRIGATDQLRHYARLLDSPFKEVGTANELVREVEGLREKSILVDTAGRGQRMREGLEPLLALRESFGAEASIELVIDATVRREIQQAQLARFAVLKPDRIIFAKTDECESLADVTNLLLDPACPSLCWMGTGQRVPEDLAAVEAKRLAQSALGVSA